MLTSGNKKNLKKPNLIPRETGKRGANKTQSQQKEKNCKDQSRNKWDLFDCLPKQIREAQESWQIKKKVLLLLYSFAQT